MSTSIVVPFGAVIMKSASPFSHAETFPKFWKSSYVRYVYLLYSSLFKKVSCKPLWRWSFHLSISASSLLSSSSSFCIASISYSNSGSDVLPTHFILFFSVFSMYPIPSSTLVISYILLFYTLNNLTVSFKSIVLFGDSLIKVTIFFVKTLKELSILYFVLFLEELKPFDCSCFSIMEPSIESSSRFDSSSSSNSIFYFF